MEQKSGEYAVRGDYHKHLDPKWSYYPIYIRKIAYIDSWLAKQSQSLKILDAGCGEGVLVDRYRKKGWAIEGIDLNYSSDLVKRGSILAMPYEDKTFDCIFLLDVIEHLNYVDQEQCLAELKRILKDDGTLIVSIPNLAHLASRMSFLLNGELIRTANIRKHPGDRPIKEYLNIIRNKEFIVSGVVPIKLTLPARLEKMVNFFLRGMIRDMFYFSRLWKPGLCFLNILILKKHMNDVS